MMHLARWVSAWKTECTTTTVMMPNCCCQQIARHFRRFSEWVKCSFCCHSLQPVHTYVWRVQSSSMNAGSHSMPMDVHCSCRQSDCKPRALPESSGSACRENTVCWIGGTPAATPAQTTMAATWLHMLIQTCTGTCIPCSTPILPLCVTVKHTTEIAIQAMAVWPAHQLSLHVAAASAASSFSLCKLVTTVFGPFRCAGSSYHATARSSVRWSAQVRLGMKHPLMGCTRRTSCIYESRHDCLRETG